MRLGAMLKAVTDRGLDYRVSGLSPVELQRQRLYMVRAHYADPDHGDTGDIDCPLYYGSIEGPGGAVDQTVANLKNLPREGAAKDYRMVSVHNHVPKAVRTDVSCMLNDFSWDRTVVKVDGEEDDALGQFIRDVFRESERRKSWTLHGMLFAGASRGDCYARAKADPNYETGVRFDAPLAEGVYPYFEGWSGLMPQSYRMLYRIMADEMPRDPGQPMRPTVTQTHVERLDAGAVEVFRDDVRIPEMSGPHGLGRIPMVHIPYRESGRFFGIPAVDADTVSAIDQANIKAANLASVLLMGYGVPNLFLYGVADAGNWAWGRRGVHGMPEGGKAELLHFEGIADLMGAVEADAQALRQRIVQFVIDDVRQSTESGVALAIRLYPYDTYLAQIERQYEQGINELGQLALLIAGKYPQRGSVEICVGWGARFPTDIMARLQAAEIQLRIFGQDSELIGELARREGYSPELVQRLIDRAQAHEEAGLQKAQADAYGGGLLGASRAEQIKAQRMEQVKAKGLLDG